MTKRTDVTTSQEERLECVINVYKHQYGASHDLVIRHYKMLAQLYVKIREEKHAEAVWRELHEIIDTRFGKGSEVSNLAYFLLIGYIDMFFSGENQHLVRNSAVTALHAWHSCR